MGNMSPAEPPLSSPALKETQGDQGAAVTPPRPHPGDATATSTPSNLYYNKVICINILLYRHMVFLSFFFSFLRALHATNLAIMDMQDQSLGCTLANPMTRSQEPYIGAETLGLTGNDFSAAPLHSKLIRMTVRQRSQQPFPNSNTGTQVVYIQG